VQAETSEIAKSHHGGLTSDGGKCVDIIIVSNATGRDDRYAARAGSSVEIEIGATHGAVSIDCGDVQSRNAGNLTALKRVLDAQSARRGPAANGDATVGDVQCDEQTFTNRPREKFQRLVVLPDRRAHDDTARARFEGRAGGANRTYATRDLQRDTTGDVCTSLDHVAP
jgi:hypothetical protein